MPDNTESVAARTKPEEKPPRRSWFAWLFPLVIVTLAVLLIAGAWSVRVLPDGRLLTLDYKFTFALIVSGIVLVSLSFWFAFWTRYSRRVRYAVPIVFWATIGTFFALFRIDVSGDMMPSRIVPRWGRPSDADLARDAGHTIVDLTTTTENDYPRFLGPRGMPIVDGVTLDTDWDNHPPELMWRQPIGAGWSAFAVVGDHAVTQEQRGDEEMVVCYEVATGRIMWSHADTGRFSSPLGGDGPRATPTIHDGRVYVHTASGLLHCLDGATGSVIWSHDTLGENGATNVKWGKSGSPLVVDDLVIVSVGGPRGRSLIAYDRVNGSEVWSGGSDPSSYASPTLATIGGVRQVISVNQDRVTSHRLDDGQVLWSHPWPGNSGSNATVSQPVPLADDRVFLSKGYQEGCQLLAIERNAAGEFVPRKVWENKRSMHTKFTNVVVKGEFIYGLSGGILECIDQQTGRRRWKRGRYGHGQMILVGDVLLVTTESGEVVLVAANPDRFEELARFQAIEGKTWNNPALAGPFLLVRNHLEAACYRLPLLEAAPAGP